MRSGDVSLALAEAGDPVRPTVVMIHGYPDTKEVWDPVMERLADDFAAVREAVSPDRPVHLVGHDWGGIQGWEFVCDPRFAGVIASFTSIAGPALGHAVRATRRPLRSGRPATALARARRSWYVVLLCLPGGPQLAWRVLLGPRRWRRYMELEGVPTEPSYPSPTVCADGVNGAKLYRRNIPRRVLGRPRMGRAHAAVQLIVPAGDRFIPASYYDAAEDVAPGLRRRAVPGSHWAIRTEPGLISDWVAEFARAASPPEPD